MLEINQYTINKKGSEKSFGFVFFVFFLFLSILPLFYDKNFNQTLLYIALIILTITLLFPKFFYYPNLIWMKFGELLNYIISPLVMLVIFITAFVTTKIFLFIFNKRLMNDKFDSNTKSYWIDYEKNKGSMRDQY